MSIQPTSQETALTKVEIAREDTKLIVPIDETLQEAIKQGIKEVTETKSLIEAKPPVTVSVEEVAPPKIEEGANDPFLVGKVHHIGGRESQQDSFGISNMKNQMIAQTKGILSVVADGMGGLSRGAEISSLVTVSMLRYFHEHIFREKYDMEMLKMLYRANDEVNHLLGEKGVGKSGTTVVAAMIKKEMLYFIGVGDSRLYLFRNGTLLKLNREHVYSRQLDEKAARGDILLSEARFHPMRYALTSFLGIGDLDEIDRNTEGIKLTKKDRILLMTDGIYGALSEEEIIKCMLETPKESAACMERMILNKNKTGQDNFTCIILEYREENEPSQ